MTRTQFCDSSGLHTLLAAHKRAQAEGGELLLAIAAAPVLRVLAITSIDRMIPNFRTLDETLAQTSADGPNGHRRADCAPEGSQENKLVAQYAISELDEKPMAVASASVGIPDRAISSGADSCAFSGLRHAWDAGLGDGCGRSQRW
jgi:STAS domain